MPSWMPTWIPYWAFYIVHVSPDELRVVCPPNLELFVLFNYFAYRFVFLKLPAGSPPRETKPAGVLLLLGIYFVLLGLVMSHGSITLDRKAGTATVHNVYIMYIPWTETIPLSQVHRADLHYSPGSDHLVLNTDRLESYSISGWTSTGGQAKAVNAINDFLRDYRLSQNP